LGSLKKKIKIPLPQDNTQISEQLRKKAAYKTDGLIYWLRRAGPTLRVILGWLRRAVPLKRDRMPSCFAFHLYINTLLRDKVGLLDYEKTPFNSLRKFI
jgi:hypothetical protein